MRFGVVVGAPTRAGYVEAVRRAEQLGYDVVLCSDHLELAGRHFSHFAPVPALTAAAMATERIRIGTSVLNQDFRHPAVLAREAASLDVLSDGRLELGLGMGWNEPEYRMAGIPFDPAPERLRRLSEYVQVVKGVMAPGPFSFSGEFFAVDSMADEPPVLQRPHPPIMIGATRPRMLALAAREADIVSLSMLQAPTPVTRRSPRWSSRSGRPRPTASRSRAATAACRDDPPPHRRSRRRPRGDRRRRAFHLDAGVEVRRGGAGRLADGADRPAARWRRS